MKIIAFVHTEYHLLLLINEIIKHVKDEFVVFLMFKSNSQRLKMNYDFSVLPNAKFSTKEVKYDLNKKFNIDHVELLDFVKTGEFSRLYFFQEQDPVILSIIKSVKKIKKKCSVCLFQDGLKPYNNLRGQSLGMLIGDIKTWRWLWRNGIREMKPARLLQTKKYAYTDEVDSIYLTFPQSYSNWNGKDINKIEFITHAVFKDILEKVFLWKEELLSIHDGIIFYLTQPMHHDANIEIEFLRSLKKALNKPLVLKLHPLTGKEQIIKYKNISTDVYIIDSIIPAEIYIMNLTNSIILSINSTSMFYNSPTNRYYYVTNIFRDKIKRLARYKFNQSPSEHISMINNINEIV